jgi:hypothetical protein
MFDLRSVFRKRNRKDRENYYGKLTVTFPIWLTARWNSPFPCALGVVSPGFRTLASNCRSAFSSAPVSWSIQTVPWMEVITSGNMPKLESVPSPPSDVLSTE